MIVTVTSVVGRSVSVWQRQWYCCYCHCGWCYMFIIAAVATCSVLTPQPEDPVE